MIKLESPRYHKDRDGQCAYGLQDPKTGAGIMLVDGPGGLYSINVDENHLHLLAERGLRLEIRRTSRNNFVLGIGVATKLEVAPQPVENFDCEEDDLGVCGVNKE